MSTVFLITWLMLVTLYICTYIPHICVSNIWYIYASWQAYLFLLICVNKCEVNIACCFLAHISTNVGLVWPDRMRTAVTSICNVTAIFVQLYMAVTCNAVCKVCVECSWPHG